MLYDQFGEMLLWILSRELTARGLEHVAERLLDDNAILVRTEREAWTVFSLVQEVCSALGVRLAPKKLQSPTQTPIFLGFVWDLIRGVLGLTADKLRKLDGRLQAWDKPVGSRFTLKDLQSLLGYLEHAAMVLAPARAFMRRLQDAARVGGPAFAAVYLSTAMVSDLAFWRELRARQACHWLPLPRVRHRHEAQDVEGIPDLQEVTAYTDASEGGMGGHWGPRFFAAVWPQGSLQATSITYLEAYAVLTAVRLWGPQMRGRMWRILSDNRGVVDDFRRQRSPSCPLIQGIIREVALLTIEFGFELVLDWIPTHCNPIADALSRQSVHRLHPAQAAWLRLREAVPATWTSTDSLMQRAWTRL